MAAPKKKCVQFSVDVHFTSEVEKSSFSERLSSVRDRLTPRESQSLSNHELLMSPFSLVDKITSEPSPRNQAHQCPSRGSFLRNSGKLYWVVFMGKCLQSGKKYPGVLVRGSGG